MPQGQSKPRWSQAAETVCQHLLNRFQIHLPLLLLWGLPLLLVGFFQLEHQSLMAHDEGLYARRARVIVDSGDWVHPWAAPHHKTPGPYWLLAPFIQLLGRTEVAVRLPSVVASLVCLGLTYAIGKRLLDQRAALLGSLSLAVTPLWLQYSRLATPDIPFTMLILAAVWLLLADSGRWRWFLAGVSLGLAVLMRSFLAALPVVCLLPYLLLSGRDRLRHWSLYGGVLAGLTPTAVWLLLCWQRYGQAIIDSLVGFPVSQGLDSYRSTSAFFYLFNLLVNDLGWFFFTMAAALLLGRRLIQALKKTGVKALQSPQFSLLLAYPLGYLGLLSLASTKLPHYALPAYPFLALLAGYAMERLLTVTRARGLTAVSLVLGLLGGGLVTVAAMLLWPGLLEAADLRPFAPAALALGLAWLGAGIAWIQGRSTLLWIGLLLLGHWSALGLAWGTAQLGNVNPELKTLLLGAEPVLAVEPVGFSPGLDSKRSTLLRFYTPNLGPKLQTLEQVEPNSFLWIEAPELEQLPDSYRVLGRVDDTLLVQLGPSSP